MKTQHCRIGRNPANDLVINDRAAEDFHAVISLNEDNLMFIEDLASRYGTIVNGDRVAKTQLFPGDIVQIGFSRIDWETVTDVKSSLSEIELIPNMSVPVKRSILKSKTISDETGKGEMNQTSLRNASKLLADDVMKTTELVDRIEKEFNLIPSVNIVPDSLEIDSNQSVEISNSLNNEEQAEVPQQNTVNSVDTLTSIFPNVLNQTIETETSKAILNMDIENQTEKETIEHSDHLPLEDFIDLHLDHFQPTNVEKDNNTIVFEHIQKTESIAAFQTEKHEDSNQKQDSIFDSQIIPSAKGENRLSQDTLQIIIAITITALLLAAGWLIGHVS